MQIFLLVPATETKQEELQKRDEIQENQPKFDTPTNNETNIKNVPDVVHGICSLIIIFYFFYLIFSFFNLEKIIFPPFSSWSFFMPPHKI